MKLAFSINKKGKAEATRGLGFTNKALLIFIIILSVLSWYFYYKQGLTLAYNDARSHLDVARRVFDNLQPGFVQLGSVWLPLFHILELPLIWNDFLWKSGMAGSLISMLSFVLGGVYLLKLTKELKFDKYGKVIAFLVYATNPNLLFMQTTPMTESLLIFLAIASTYYLIRWSKTLYFLDLINCAIFVFLSTLTRYDGWFLLMFVAGVVAVIARKRKTYTFAEGNLIFFLTLAGVGVFLWFAWNLLIFGDPFYFVLGPFSAKAQQDVLLAEGQLLTKGDLVYSTFIYFLASTFNLGIIITILTIVGTVLFFTYKKVSFSVKLATSILFVPFVFNVVSLFFGHSVIHLPGLTPFTWFNDRYGLMVLPAAAVFVGFLGQKNKLIFGLLVLSLFAQTSHMYLKNDIITIQDGVRGASGQYLDTASSWMKDNIHGGLILVAASSNDSLMFTSGMHLKQFITEGAKIYWEESMVNPTTYADWVIMHNGDLVERNLRNNDMFLNNYQLVYKDQFSYIYKLNNGATGRLTEDDLPGAN